MHDHKEKDLLERDTRKLQVSYFKLRTLDAIRAPDLPQS